MPNDKFIELLDNSTKEQIIELTTFILEERLTDLEGIEAIKPWVEKTGMNTDLLIPDEEDETDDSYDPEDKEYMKMKVVKFL